MTRILAVAALSSLITLACGPTATPAPETSPPPPTPDAPAPAPADKGWPAELAALTKTGATFEIVADDDSTLVIRGEVTKADDTAIEIRWTEGTEPSTYMMPTTISRSGATITIDEAQFGGRGDGAAGRTVRTDNGIVCYEEGPEPDAGDCPDVCFSTICFHAAHGVVQVQGNWGINGGYATSPKCTQSGGSLRCN